MKMETILEQTHDDINWIIVRPTYLLYGKPSDYFVENRKAGNRNYNIYRVTLPTLLSKN